MTFKDVRLLVAKGESSTVEFKRKVAHPEKIVKELVAFANSKGGYLIVGVNDDGTIPGLKFPEDESYVLKQAIAKYCKPSIEYQEEIIPISEKKSVVIYQIPPSKRRPHYVIRNFRSNWGPVFVRVEDKSIQASKEVKEIIKRSRKNKDIKFNYGEKEKHLFEFLDENHSITLKQFMKLTQVNYYKASRTLVLLVLANVLTIEPNDKGDLYRLKNNYN